MFLLVCSYSCRNKSIQSEHESSIPPLQESVTVVHTAFSEVKNFEYFIRMNGKVHSAQEQVILTATGGILTSIMIKTGDIIRTGYVAAQFETSTLQYRLERAKLAKFNGEKEYLSQLLGYESLLKDRSKEQSEDIKQKLKISTGLSSAEQDIKEANYEISKSTIYAPFTGIITDLKVQRGQQVRPGEELFRMYDPNNLLLQVKVLETDVYLLKKGTIAEVMPIGNKSKKYSAFVSEINPYVDVNGMVEIKLKLTSRNLQTETFFPGMNCTAIIKIPMGITLIVPKEAVVMRNGKAVIFTLEKGLAKWNYVTTGKENDKDIEIKEGLKPKQKVIITNNLQLAHDAPVKENVDSDSLTESVN
nr:efflux RND transporter periplasmic adaptor subunit [Pedobacter sp. Hv1]